MKTIMYKNMRKIIGLTILVIFFGGLHTYIFYFLGSDIGLFVFLAYPMTALIVLAVRLMTD